MIRVLYIQPVAECGGSDQALLRMIKSLPSDDFECHAVLPAPSPMADAYVAAGCRLHVVPMRRLTASGSWRYWASYLLAWPVSVFRLARLIRAIDADIVHSNSLHSLYGWAAALVTRRPHVWHVREIVVQSSAALTLERRLARRFAARVVAISEAVARQLDRRNVEVIYDTADPEEFRPDLAGRFRSAVGIPDDAPVWGAIGRLDTWKGFDVVLDAFEGVCRRLPEAHLVVAGPVVEGKEDYALALARRADGYPNVCWLGSRADAAELLTDLDVFVLASTEPEPYGLVLVEALSCGVPVVATDQGGPPEILARAVPNSGSLVPPRDAGALEEAVVSRLRDIETSTAARKGRASLLHEEPPPFADLYAAVLSTP